MILLVDSEGPDQTARHMQADLGLCCLHMPEDLFAHGVTHIIMVKNEGVPIFMVNM